MTFAATVLQVQGAHSVHHPASPQAHRIAELGDAMYITAAIIFVLVVAALLWSALRRRRDDEAADPRRTDRSMSTAVLLAAAVTTVILFVFLVLDLSVGRALTSNPGDGALQVRVTGHQWWWEVQYRDSLPQNWATTANEIHVPVGRPVVFELRAADVIHSLWPPNLNGKRDLIPGDENSLWFQAESAGVYRAQCAEFCGHQHARMGLLIVAESEDSFGAWLSRQRDTAMTPTDSIAARGQKVFLASSCVMCHTIAGTPAGSRIGPDLTHLASRRTLAAGTLPNTRGNLAGWIINPQAIKPGVLMPPNRLDPDDLQALLTYLGTLE
jgi:cytochrome c oxidase subunit II